ncbi:MAG TPA: ATP-binding protein [Polyangiales bacterium]|nr:ATP-binding protein [Polyangiales bacterium]
MSESEDAAAAQRNSSALLDTDVRRRVMSSFRLQVKLVVMIGVIFAVLGGGLFMIVERIFDELTPSIRHDLEWKARHAVVELCNTGAIGVIADDTEAVSSAARELLADTDVVAVQVMGRTAPVLTLGEVPFAWEAVTQAADRTVIERDNLLVAAGPVEIEGLTIGRVTIAVSTKRLSAGRQLRLDIWRVGALGALFAFGLSLLFVRYDIGPLIKLTAEAFAKLERTTVAALESARIKSEFLANMSHEIRTPMNGIMGVTKLLLLMPMETKMRRYVEVIDSSARGLLTIINDVLDFSKLEAGKYKIRPIGFDPHLLVRDCVTLFGERARERGLAINLHVAQDVPMGLIGDPDRIRQILDNLVGNAVKFTAQGEVSIHVGLEREAQHLYLCLLVRDTGAGISLEDQKRLFQAFTQVDGSSVRVHGGTGLGLAIVKNLVELMNGEVRLHSELGRGSEFFVKLRVQPMSEQELAAEAAQEEAAEELRSRTRMSRPPILVVDDNEINRMVAVEHLKHLGCIPDIASNGAEALQAVFEKEYALVLMDCQMPVMDGYSATRAIRQRERELGRERMPIIALTAHVLDGEREKVLAAGMDEHMPKPVHPQRLQALLTQYLGRAPADFKVSVKPAAPPSATPVSGVIAEPANTQSDELPAQLEVSAAIVGLFLKLSPGQLKDLAEAVAARDAARARDLAHKFKGGLYSVSATGLAGAVESLREKLARERWSDVGLQLSDIERRFAHICDQLRMRSVSTGS